MLICRGKAQGRPDMLRQFSAIFDVPFWGRGFRPFFLLGAIYAALMVLAWVFFLHGLITVPMLWNNPVLWHAHEMIYGFTVAIIAGFLLTAVANWTGSAPVRRINLAFLCIIWTVGRIAFWLPYASPAVLSSTGLQSIQI